MKIINREIASAMIFSKDGKLLLGKKHADKGGVYVDFWHIPGGGVENGEDLETALSREIKEEIGISLDKYKIELFDDLGFGESERIYENEKVLCKMHFTVFKVVIYDQNASDIKIALNDDIEHVEWVELKDLAKYKLTPPSIELFKRKGII